MGYDPSFIGYADIGGCISDLPELHTRNQARKLAQRIRSDTVRVTLERAGEGMYLVRMHHKPIPYTLTTPYRECIRAAQSGEQSIDATIGAAILSAMGSLARGCVRFKAGGRVWMVNRNGSYGFVSVDDSGSVDGRMRVFGPGSGQHSKSLQRTHITGIVGADKHDIGRDDWEEALAVVNLRVRERLARGMEVSPQLGAWAGQEALGNWWKHNKRAAPARLLSDKRVQTAIGVVVGGGSIAQRITVGGESVGGVDEGFITTESKLSLDRAMNLLSPTMQDMIRAWARGAKKKDIAEYYNVSHQYVSQVIAQGIEELRELIPTDE